ncbi:hypothetical protein HBI56_226550 [Parastagonospora nodorum]|uniref:Uncharacterized protein n=1 Tax=Phaeosphaeria nodorum (strain SN15 / ATCC MYA-4574 / FGSC 10173) TaxID=321614 RepID=A0A7U2EZ27_PHANO|nr:hypothetical protein HBH56_226990 [Parastagonospora nodorum]QRC95738.1 hypothetical protein JI435_407880 [Parastagonospora nodorum SN15]KAH3921674.1 hypothetical protein HBH54_235820 [Parastagonospora nodorum]KAH3959050.1 hypothetical protein HBH51_202870 [Parastagonospora nodorum]KAH3963600.1 hypothetical protein HBH52_216940 [Parastagonospora nodorum]
MLYNGCDPRLGVICVFVTHASSAALPLLTIVPSLDQTAATCHHRHSLARGCLHNAPDHVQA